ncbi:hypothetical protein GCM10025771_02870 [Niveibacterium umoris]|uniref:Putative MFS family arabinose efflux permease n=1 Tax=Niveibacterium umoris TaxID=1193620 RepID=A0A840BKS8_9RHOO|nr:MFS transporter [Niveibacterium umoris]MBB4014171.1 putative MFS family arabinose efflux permease [Niveibacterium umoris]
MSVAPASPRALQARLMAAILIVVMAGLLAASWATQRAFESGLRPELLRKAAVVGASVGELVGKTLDHGLALRDLVGVEAYLQAVRKQHPELAYLALCDDSGRVLFKSGSPAATAGISVSLTHAARPAGAVEASLSAAFIRQILFESTLDLLVVCLVAVFFTRELLHAITASDPRLGSVGTEGDAVLARVRAPLFLFMLAEELTRAFLPGFSRALLPSTSTLAPDVLVGVPIVVFMLVVALGQPVLASWSERVGHRRAMQWGAALGVCGLGGAALSGGIVDFIAWRALCGLAYAIVFVAGQGFVIAHTDAASRSRGFALFVTAIMVAAVCGPPVGGILADHLGARWGFGAAASLAVAALMVVRTLPRDAQASITAPSRAPVLRDFLRLFRQRSFVVITLLAAVPAKLILAGFCFYLVPVYLLSLGAPPSVAGRALMVYAVVLVLMLPQATRLAERGVAHAHLVGVGLCISSLGGFGLLAWGGVLPVYLAMALLGLGQGLSIAAQSTLLSLACSSEIEAHGSGPVFGVYRLIERLGNASGPLVTGVLVALLGHAAAFATVSAIVLICGLCFVALTGNTRVPVSVGARA